MNIKPNEVLALVGESGSGKSATAFSLMGLHTKARIEGEVNFLDRNMLKLSDGKMIKTRWRYGDDLSGSDDGIESTHEGQTADYRNVEDT
ncbi:ATP-binding cassette domain-containing protein [Salinicoccus siamensis]|uniref:ATP-binding cassette domain-containing protein n=1 Tax=Salinicoccus siamensis TaxID=381830 RepID=UPI00361C0326